MSFKVPELPDHISNNLFYACMSERCQKFIVGSLKTNSLIHYSLISSTTKHQAESINRIACYIGFQLNHREITIYSDLPDMTCMKFTIPPIPPRWKPLSKIPTPTSIATYSFRRMTIWTKPEYSWTCWMTHLADVLHCRKLKLVFDEGADKYQVEAFKKIFEEKFEVLSVRVERNQMEFTGQILRMLHPTRELFLNPADADDSIIYSIPGNLEVLEFGDKFPLTISHLEKLDSQNIKIWLLMVTDFDLNTFLKKWISLKTNLNLKQLIARFGLVSISEGYQQRILNGIPYYLVEQSEEDKSIGKVVGKYQIQRRDGRRAVLTFDTTIFPVRVKMVIVD
ncbi:hypothetical protein CRE_21549 [Caenorhabditis remanei]|uniref:Sdz-33 F-box domain-containing protein n=1 Tax=Caenorhabditis remanei TaxID=31234 RepID=E3NCQ3_CAERE|nr:hypothetical protein CRE_21549 [Caenorhabditis remanei]